MVQSAVSKAPIIAAHGLSACAMGVLGAVTMLYPDNEVCLILFPFVKFKIINMIGPLILFELFGMLRGWRVMCHSAHLGGLLFGMSYFHILSKTKGTTPNGVCLTNMNIYNGWLNFKN